MRMKWIASTFAAALLSTAAMAQGVVIKFESASGTVSTWTFNPDGTMSNDAGMSGTYTWDEEAKTICGEVEENELCATFEEVSQEPGATTGYTTTTGDSGTATLISAPSE